ncbi:DUF4236 domain-containing protein [Psychrobacter sp. CAL346-MNA-CIBAN-0220]|uniref:DUF4236 domain-containing protein n=1 Tax=Psychrobacter sp. CAL346-MNA-CIBAN-0220 TaxID=3140457 RepID=UPI00387E3626
MGFRFRKSIKIVPGVRLNLTKKGISSLSVGKRGATVNIGKKGTRGTVGLPGSGLSYSSYQSHAKSKTEPRHQDQHNSIADSARPPLPPILDINPTQKQVSIMLGIGIFLLPIIFSWFTLRQGYSTVNRAISMVWMIIFIFAMR